MVKSFYSREEEKIYHREYSRRFPITIQRVALRKLWMIDAAVDLKDLRIPPANRLEKLHGKREGQYSILINKQWRICFTWRNNSAYEIEIIDYH